MKSAVKNGTEVTLNVSSNLIGNSNDETNIPNKLLLTDTQVSKIRKAFANGSSANIKFSKTQLSKNVRLGGVLRDIPIFGNILSSVAKKGTDIANNEIKDIMKVIKSLENKGILLKGTTTKITSQEGGFLNFLRPLMTAGLPFMKNLVTLLAKNDLLPFGLSAGMSAADAAIQKKVYGSGRLSDLASRTTALIISNEEMEDIMKIVKSLEQSGLLMQGINEIIKNETKE